MTRPRGDRSRRLASERVLSPAAWLAHRYRCDYRTALRVVETAEALRELPVARRRRFERGALTLDQVAAAAPIATPESDAEIARIAVGKAPSQIAREARRIVPPRVVDDQRDLRRRALRMTWTNGGRELVFSGQLPLEHGAAFEQAIRELAKLATRRRQEEAERSSSWQQSAADALVTPRPAGRRRLDGVRRSPTTLIVHVSDDGRRCSKAPARSAARPPSDSPATPPAHDQAQGVTSCTRASDAAPPMPSSARSTSAQAATASTRAAPPPANCRPTTSSTTRAAARPSSRNLILLCSRHHKLLHDHHIRTGGTGETTHLRRSGRTGDHRQPATRTTPLSDAVAGELLLVDLDAETGAGGHAHEAVG